MSFDASLRICVFKDDFFLLKSSSSSTALGFSMLGIGILFFVPVSTVLYRPSDGTFVIIWPRLYQVSKICHFLPQVSHKSDEISAICEYNKSNCLITKIKNVPITSSKIFQKMKLIIKENCTDPSTSSTRACPPRAKVDRVDNMTMGRMKGPSTVISSETCSGRSLHTISTLVSQISLRFGGKCVENLWKIRYFYQGNWYFFWVRMKKGVRMNCCLILKCFQGKLNGFLAVMDGVLNSF